MKNENPESQAKKSIYLGILINQKNISQFTHLATYPMETGSQARPVLFFFTLHDLDWAVGNVKGLHFDSKRLCWEKKIFPLPDVVYLRKMPDPRDKTAQTFFKMIQSLKIPLVNSLPTFNKWDIHRVLHGYDGIRPHLPHTILYSGRDSDILAMVNRYGKAYLKGCSGSGGREVMQISLRPGGGLEYRSFDIRLHLRRINRKSLHRVVKNFFGRDDFIIQQPIDLIRSGQSQVDIRAEVQRNGKGELEVVALPVRMGSAGSPISTHAASYPFREFFSRQMNYKPAALDQLYCKLQNLLLSIYQAVEDSYGPFGELGIDIGLDTKDRLWFIECNSQSAKVSLMNAYDNDTALKTFTNPLLYALYIADPNH